MTRSLAAVLAAVAGVLTIAVATATARESAKAPTTIALPNGFQPEGIATAGPTFYVGSIPTGAVYRGNVLTGKGAILVPAQAGRAAIGIEESRGQLFVAGGATGNAYVYDARTGADVGTFDLATEDPTFINDVVVSNRFAWFTDSLQQFVYRLTLVNGRATSTSAVTRIPITGDLVYTGGFNANGIERAASGALIIVKTNSGTLFKVNGATGVSKQISLGSKNVANGDGLLLSGMTLYVVQNQLNQIAKIQLRPGLASGKVLKLITSPNFAVPTTVDRFGAFLYAVNARFGTPPTPDTTYSVARVRM